MDEHQRVLYSFPDRSWGQWVDQRERWLLEFNAVCRRDVPFFEFNRLLSQTNTYASNFSDSLGVYFLLAYDRMCLIDIYQSYRFLRQSFTPAPFKGNLVICPECGFRYCLSTKQTFDERLLNSSITRRIYIAHHSYGICPELPLRRYQNAGFPNADLANFVQENLDYVRGADQIRDQATRGWNERLQTLETQRNNILSNLNDPITDFFFNRWEEVTTLGQLLVAELAEMLWQKGVTGDPNAAIDYALLYLACPPDNLWPKTGRLRKKYATALAFALGITKNVGVLLSTDKRRGYYANYIYSQLTE